MRFPILQWSSLRDSRRLGLGFFQILLLGLLPACSRPPELPPSPPVPVTVAHPVRREVVERHELTARLEAAETVDIQARVGGALLSVHFEDGAEVTAGDLLFTIDPAPYEAEWARAEAERKRIEAQRNLARKELDRADQLLRSSTISPEEHEQRGLRVHELEAALQAAEAGLRTARLRLEYTEVRAPISGVIGRRLVTPGNLISEPPFQPTILATLVSVDPVYCYTSVSEQAFLRYQSLMQEGHFNGSIPCEVALAGQTEFQHPGVIDFVDNRVDPTTGTIRLRATMPNPNRKLTPGLFARIRIPSSPPYSALMVPETAIGSDQGLKLVFVLDADQQVEPRPVRLGPTLDGYRVVLEGLTATDRVVINGLARIRPGMTVQPTMEGANP